ncbi:hypothetical protein L1987_13594 [Smallanthus sonchifolius]|uniref:Uncharacterized protein n=1 Tax=Smallanthus sonchifolius TaxID=185202 RepID=A0ACB9JJ34_9ASTR|nr:hypothetical protein L1987_13594 [Smallanthus sonchifolius]
MNQRQMKPQMSQQMSQQNALASGQIPFTFKLKNIENKRLLWCSGFPDFRFPVKHAKRVRNLQPHSLQGSDYIACFILFIGFAFHYESNCKLYVPNKKQCLMLAYFLM